MEERRTGRELVDEAAAELPLVRAVEALLFATPEPVTVERLAYALEVETHQAYAAVVELRYQYGAGRGIKILSVAGGYQMATHPDFAAQVGRLLGPAPSRLSRAALETLSIVAYRQPITLPEIEAVRGVSCDGVVKTLADKSLIQEAGRKETPGRPILYGTTEHFLVHFGLKELADLPALEEVVEAE